MKPKSLIAGLVLLSLGLVGTIAYVQRPGPEPNRLDTAASAPVDPSSVARATVQASNSIALTPPPFSWRQVESDDYHQYIANLRAVGCPEQTIRDIILADVNKLYAAREEPLKTKKASADKPSTESAEQALERLTQLRAVQQEKRWVVKELLGVDLPLDLLPSSGARDYHAFEVALGFLPSDKRDAVQALQENYWQQSDALKAKYDKKKTPEFVSESRQLTESLRQELGKVLSPQELEDYEMRSSSDAKQLSTKLATYFQPSEDEFRKIFRAKREYEDAIQKLSTPAVPAPVPADLEERKALAQQRAAERQATEQARASAMSQMNDQLKGTLGEERFGEYQRSQDRTYDLLARLGVRYNLPQEKVLEAYEAQKSFQIGSGAIDSSVVAQPADRADLQRQLNDRLTSILGEQAARGYRRVNGGTVPLK